MPTHSILTFVLAVASSTVFAAVITQLVTIVRDHRKTKREAAFTALFVAIALEDYASTCSNLISDSENFDSTDGQVGKAHGKVAELPDYPASVEWKPFGIDDTTKVLSFRVDVDNTRAMLSDMWDFQDEDSIVPLVREQSARLGRDALALAADLRQRWRLAPVVDGGEWNVRAHLDERLDHYSTKRLELRVRESLLNAELMDDAATDQDAPSTQPPDST